MRYIWLCTWLVLLSLSNLLADEDFYKLLGVSKDADNRSIRKAFKKIALVKHPDKNPDDKNAHAEFVRLNRAYEVLMNEDLRKKYDKFGEKGLSDDFQGGDQYQSWQFYHDNFGIYDDDVEIVTLSRADFEQEVLESGEVWFVNFYSTFCSHCHHLAPTWRKFARQMEGVLHIGAVNCAEDPMLCQSQNVNGYPSLVLFPQRLVYNGRRELDDLLEFAMEHITAGIYRLTELNIRNYAEQHEDRGWVVDFCTGQSDCLSDINRRKLASMLEAMLNVATVNCDEEQSLCSKLERTEGVVYFPPGKIDEQNAKDIESLDPKEISSIVHGFLPEIEALTPSQLEDIHEAESREEIVLVRMELSSKSAESSAGLKTLPFKLADTAKVYVLDCSKSASLCGNFGELPKWVLFKKNGGFEIYYGKKNTVHDLVAFVREAMQSAMISLTPEAYDEALSSGEEWLIDYFAPWCPPCLRLLHELRKAQPMIDGVRIGTVDCVHNAAICQRAGVNSYPTTMFYKDKVPHTNVGFHHAEEIAEFIDDIRNPSVKVLTSAEFKDEVTDRAEGTVWFVDFFAPWCGPCQQLAPQFRRLARHVRERYKTVYFGTVDCDANRALCTETGVNAYPTIRLFTSDLKQSPLDYPTNWWRDVDSMGRWLIEFLPSKVTKLGNDFAEKVLDDDQPWLVDFFASWCGHCIQFAPVFEQIAEVLEGRVKLAKVDCDKWHVACARAGVHSYPTIRLYTGAVDGVTQDVYGLTVNSQHFETVIRIVEHQLEQLQQRKLNVKTEL